MIFFKAKITIVHKCIIILNANLFVCFNNFINFYQYYKFKYIHILVSFESLVNKNFHFQDLSPNF